MHIDNNLVKQAIEDRRHLHQHPELSGEEYETYTFIRNRLESLNIEILNYQPPSVVGSALSIKRLVSKKYVRICQNMHFESFYCQF